MSTLLQKIVGLNAKWREEMQTPSYEDLLELERLARDPDPIPMILHCPACGLQHIDAADFVPDAGTDPVREVWDNPPHKSHKCAGCEFQWRPADVNTTGVAAIVTRHKDDSPKRVNLHDDLELIYNLAKLGLKNRVRIIESLENRTEALTRIRELSNRGRLSEDDEKVGRGFASMDPQRQRELAVRSGDTFGPTEGS